MAVARRPSQRLTLVILILISVTVITLDYRGAAKRDIDHLRGAVADTFAPVQRGVADVLHPVGDFVAGAFDYGTAQAENVELQATNGDLRRELAENATASTRLQQLLALAHLPYVGNIRSVDASVIAGSSSNFELTIEIDRGTSSGVGVNMPVVAGAGLVGSIISAGATTAVVRLIDDPRSSVGVTIGVSTAVGVAVGEGGGAALSIEDVPATAHPSRGQLVYTSGLVGAAYPAGIPVGSVRRVDTPAGSLTEQISMTPLASLAGIQFVAVLEWLPTA